MSFVISFDKVATAATYIYSGYIRNIAALNDNAIRKSYSAISNIATIRNTAAVSNTAAIRNTIIISNSAL